MGSKKRARHDHDAPMPAMRDQSGLAAVAQSLAKTNQAAGGGETDDAWKRSHDLPIESNRKTKKAKDAKKDKKDTKDKHDKKEKKEKRSRDANVDVETKKQKTKLTKRDDDRVAAAGTTQDETKSDPKPTPTETQRRILQALDTLDGAVKSASKTNFPSRQLVSKTIAESVSDDFSTSIEETLFKAFGSVAARAAAGVKKGVQTNAQLMGGSRFGESASSGLDNARALAHDLKQKGTPRSSVAGALLTKQQVTQQLGGSKLWDAVRKHNQVVWGRCLGVCETADLLLRDDGKSRDEKKDAFSELYQTAISDARLKGDFGGSLNQTTNNENAMGGGHGTPIDVSVLMRAIQRGAEIGPALRQALAVQFLSLENAATTTAGDWDGDGDAFGDGGDASGGAFGDGSGDGKKKPKNPPHDSGDDESSSDSQSIERDDEVDYAKTPGISVLTK